LFKKTFGFLFRTTKGFLVNLRGLFKKAFGFFERQPKAFPKHEAWVMGSKAAFSKLL